MALDRDMAAEYIDGLSDALARDASADREDFSREGEDIVPNGVIRNWWS
jgi:hypothetical protein